MSLIYAIGDIHGSSSKLERLIARCVEHADGCPMTFVFLGDYIDRGPDTSGVIRLLIDLQSERPDGVVALKGNHEAMALAVIDGTSPARMWLTQGGVATLESYGVACLTEIPRRHVDWMRSLKLSFDDGRRFFVHAGINPARPLDAQDAYDMLWIREPFLSDGRDYDRLIVHGHTPLTTGVPDFRSNRLNLDTGAVFGGPLTAAAFDGAQATPTAFLQVA